LPKITGSIDDLGRPLVRVEVPGRDGFLAVLDTGFNRTLMIGAAEAVAMGFTITEESEVVELATTAKVQVRQALGTIWWMNREVKIEALISNVPASTHRPDTARALVGTELLSDCLLLVDFATRVVEIETQD
jgi:predicted aspartyl protease